jgi:hypothetical protein
LSGNQTDQVTFTGTSSLCRDFKVKLDVLVNLKIFPTSGMHPQGYIFAEIVVRDKWCGFKNVVCEDIVVLDFLGQFR